MTNREDGYMTTHCTNWSTYDVPTIWSTVSDEGDAVSYAQVTAWRETSEAIEKQRTSLQSALNELSAGWPPSHSPAAQEFFDQAESVLLTMDYYAKMAATNSSALQGITNGLNEAKENIQRIRDDWVKQAAARERKSTVEKIVDTATFWSNEDAWRSDLNQQAVRVMVSTDSIVAENRQQMIVPITVTPPSLDNPTTNIPGNPPSSSDNGGGASSVLRAPFIQSPPGINTATVAGPILAAGLKASLVSSLSDPRTPTSSGPASAPDVATTIFAHGVGSTRLTEPSTAVAALGNTLGQSEIEPRIGGAKVVGPEGGVIGFTPSTMGTATGERAPISRTPSRRINQPGGVIGGKFAPVTEGEHIRSKRDTCEPATFEPDDPWRVEDGVPSVITGNTVIHEHTTGLGVIGMDR